MWLLVTDVRQLDVDSLKARHLVMTTFAHAQTFPRSQSSLTHPIVYLHGDFIGVKLTWVIRVERDSDLFRFACNV